MRRILFGFLMMTCSVSWAEWEIYYSISKGTMYLDKATIRKSGAIIKIWELTNYFEVQTNPDGSKYKSVKVRWAFNCLEETMTPIAMTQYSGSMGADDVVWSNTRKESHWDWVSLVPGTGGEEFFKVACGKK
jgi:hypothetical protein